MIKANITGDDRRQRWLHPRHLPYIWVLLISLLLMPAIAVGLVALFIVFRLGRWLQSPKG